MNTNKRENTLAETCSTWNQYYTQNKHQQEYPDENLVRLLKPLEKGVALDIGCGRGRHIKLLQDLGFSNIYASDISPKALQESFQKYPSICTIELPEEFWAGEPFQLPIEKKMLQIIIAWGVLHYNSIALTDKILNEFTRLLRPNGFFLGTLRADTDTHLNNNSNLALGNWQLYSEKDCRKLLEKHFRKIKIGYTERTLLGKLEQKICHWFFLAQL